MKQEKNTAIVLAAGQGKRMNSRIQKQFLEIDHRPVLYYSLECFQKSPLIQDIILVTGEEMISYCKKEIVERYNFTKVTKVIAGGKERYDSVYQGLLACEDCDYVFIHDGARPCVTDSIINACMHDVKIYNACVAAVPVKDTIKVVDAEGIAVNTPDRSTLWQIQTPQVFESELILEAYDKLYCDIDKKGITDDAMVVEKYMNTKVKMTLSEYTNIKATTPEDILVTEVFLTGKKML